MIIGWFDKSLVKLCKSFIYQMVLRVCVKVPYKSNGLWVIKINGHPFSLKCNHWESLLATKLIKTYLRNKMGDDFMWNYFIIYIDIELIAMTNSHDIIKAFNLVNYRRSKLFWSLLELINIQLYSANFFISLLSMIYDMHMYISYGIFSLIVFGELSGNSYVVILAPPWSWYVSISWTPTSGLTKLYLTS
jgi:hypothetical protein